MDYLDQIMGVLYTVNPPLRIVFCIIKINLLYIMKIIIKYSYVGELKILKKVYVFLYQLGACCIQSRRDRVNMCLKETETVGLCRYGWGGHGRGGVG